MAKYFRAFGDPTRLRLLELLGEGEASVGELVDQIRLSQPQVSHKHRHVFRAIERPRRILIASTEIRLDGSSFETTLEYTFKPRDGGTLMTMSQGGFPADELRDEHTIGVPHSLDRLERVLDDEHA